MTVPAEVRIDKWLWAVRLYKTRTLAANACRDGQVTIQEASVKPSRDVKINDVIKAKTGDITRTFRVIGLVEKRMGAPLVKKFAEDLTPASEYEKPKLPMFQPLFYRPKGAGRPTKKDRRKIEKLDGLV